MPHECDPERYKRWETARLAWFREAGITPLHVLRAVHWSYPGGEAECPWELPHPTRTPDPRDPRWAEWVRRR